MNCRQPIAAARRALPALLALATAAALPAAAHAQDGFWTQLAPGYRSQFYLGGSIGGAAYSDQTNQTGGWIQSNANATTNLAPGDSIATFGSQDATEFGAKVYGGVWLTPNVALELAYTSLGRMGWHTYSTNTTGSYSVDNSGTVAPRALSESVLLGLDSFGMRYFLKGGAYQASSDFSANGFDDNSGAGYGVSQTVRNSGPLVGIGVHTGRGHVAFRLEIEDYINVGTSSPQSSGLIPPWRGSIVLISAGVAYLF